MRSACGVALLLGALLFAPACSADDAEEEEDKAPGFSFDGSASWYAMRDQPSYLSIVASANRNDVHIEGRYNYEGRDAWSLFLGHSWSGGEDWSWSATPIFGGVFGSTQGVAPGLEFSLAHGSFDLYIEAEYLFSGTAHDESYFYSWNELGWRVLPSLRLSLVSQHTHIVHNDRDIQRGLQAQLTLGKVTLGIATFNPDVAARYTIFSLAAGF
jgi:hypothetical protein